MHENRPSAVAEGRLSCLKTYTRLREKTVHRETLRFAEYCLFYKACRALSKKSLIAEIGVGTAVKEDSNLPFSKLAISVQASGARSFFWDEHAIGECHQELDARLLGQFHSALLVH